MVLALIIMIAGIGAGVLLRYYGKGKACRSKEVILLFTVCLLLFIMGIRVASDPLITGNLFKIGGVAVVIFICVALGTLLAARLGSRWIDKDLPK